MIDFRIYSGTYCQSRRSLNIALRIGSSFLARAMKATCGSHLVAYCVSRVVLLLAADARSVGQRALNSNRGVA